MAPLGHPHAPHKGFGLALLVDALSGVLSGAGFARGVASGAPGSFITARGVVLLAPASWQMLATACESLAVPLPAVLDNAGGASP